MPHDFHFLERTIDDDRALSLPRRATTSRALFA